MPLDFTCPACGKKLQAPYAAAGIAGACKFCHVRIVAPYAAGQPATLLEPATPPGAAPVASIVPAGGTADLGTPIPGGPLDAMPFPVALSYAPFWKRAAGFLIDSVILYGVNLVATPVIYLLSPFPKFDLSAAIHSIQAGGQQGAPPDVGQILDPFLQHPWGFVYGYLFTLFMQGIVEWLYYGLMESSRYQGTIGKMAIGTIVTDTSGKRISFKQATTRNFLGRSLSGGLSCYIGYVMAAFTERRQALHDVIAGTVVIDR